MTSRCFFVAGDDSEVSEPICIRKFLNKLFIKKDLNFMVPKRELTFVLPYLGKLSFDLRTRPRRTMERD